MMNNEFIYSIDGNIKEKYIENFGWIDSFLKKKEATRGASKVDIYEQDSSYRGKSKKELETFLESYKNYNYDPIKNQLITDVKNDFNKSIDDELNYILQNTDYNDAKKIVELEKLKNELIERENLEYQLYYDVAKPIRDFLNIEGFAFKLGPGMGRLGGSFVDKKKAIIENIINYYKEYKKEKVDINLNPERDEFVQQINKLIIDFNSPVDCEYSYGECDSDCKRHINITKQPLRDGKSCPSSTIGCNPGEGKCPYNPIDCNEKYGACKPINGSCKKELVIYEQAKHGGKSCKLPKYENCNDGEGSCPLNCIGNFSLCNKNCEKQYQISRKAKNGGNNCPYNDKQIVSCSGGNCIESVDCVGSWSNCDSNCEKTWNITTKQQGNGQNCRFRDGVKRKCTENDDSKCKQIINRDCVGRFTTCDSNCKKKWILEDKESGDGTCEFSEGRNYDCNEGEGNCLVSKDCIGRWSTCNENCKSVWEKLRNEQGIYGKCDLSNGQERKCKDGQGLCVINENNTSSTTDNTSSTSNNNENDSSKVSINYNNLIGGFLLIILLLLLSGVFSGSKSSGSTSTDV